MKKKAVVWKMGNLNKSNQDTVFSGSDTLPTEVLDLDTPFSCFRYLFPSDIIQNIIEQTNLYSIQSRPEKYVAVAESEVESFTGISLCMSIVKLPSARHYWGTLIGHHLISDVMSVNRWE